MGKGENGPRRCSEDLEGREMGKFSEWPFISKMLNNTYKQSLMWPCVILCDQAKDLQLNTVLENEISERGQEDNLKD